jgi:hypothetical protein
MAFEVTKASWHVFMELRTYPEEDEAYYRGTGKSR